MKKFLYLSIVIFALYACGGGTQEAESSNSEPKVEKQDEAPAVATINLEGDDAMKFNMSEIKVKAGQTVKVNLKHVGKLPKAAMGHNFVLLKQGTDITAFGAKAMTAVESDYIPEGDDVIVHTGLIGGGESTSIEFPAPEKGVYDFICSFPGHYALMRGKFIVE